MKQSLTITVILSLMAAVGLFSGCSEEFLFPDEINVQIDESGTITTNAEEVGRDLFSKKIVGCGWLPQSTRLIQDDGSIGNDDQHYYLTGGYPIPALFFDETSMTSFTTYSGRNIYTSTPYKFENSSILYGKNSSIIVIEASDNYFTCIQLFGIMNDKEVWMCTIYKKMTDKQLKEYWGSYSPT